MDKEKQKSEPEHNPAQEQYDKILGKKSRAHEPSGDTPDDKNKSSKNKGEDRDLAQAEASAGNDPGEQSENSFYKPASQTSHEGQVGRGYNPKILNKSSIPGRLLGTRRRQLIFAGAVGGTVIALAIALFSFLNVFKLDGLMSNVHARAFIRSSAVLDNRSSKWTSAYVQVRLLDMGDNPDLNNNENLLFRSNRVDNNNPLLDWYKTLRTSRFEQEVFEKHGIRFTSVVTANGRVRAGLVDINRELPIRFELSQADIDRMAAGDIETINRFRNSVDVRVFENNREARREIRRVVNDNTQWAQVWQRRQLRKAIANMTGVRDWRFFETERDRLREGRIDIRNKILDKAIPQAIWGGKYVRCGLGLDDCRPSRDVNDPQNRAVAAAPDSRGGRQLSPEEQERQQRSQEEAARRLALSEPLVRVLQSANILLTAVNVVSSLDMITYVHDNLQNLVKIATVAKGIQAAGLYQVFMTSRDQMKAGDLHPEEVNEFMQVIATAGSSDGWVKVVEGDGNPAQTSTSGTCSQEHKAELATNEQLVRESQTAYAPLCADEQIGNGGRAQEVQEDYNRSVGVVAGPVVAAWKGLRDTPIVGQIIGLIGSLADRLSQVVSAALQAVLGVLGLQDDMERFISWLFGRLATFLGVGPILAGNESGGTIFNWIMQGGAYTAESTSRQLGAALTTEQSRAATQQTVSRYQNLEAEQMSLYDRVASLDNPESLAHKTVFALSGAGADPGSAFASVVQNIWGSLGKSFGVIFGGRTYAQNVNSYTASRFAGIETYDYPPVCLELDPITAQPLDGTNALDVFAEYGIGVSQDQLNELSDWRIATNSEDFYSVVYAIIGDRDNADDIAVQIFNCHLLDTAVRGSLGYLYGYTNDNGLAELSDTATGATDAGVGVSEEGFVFPLRTNQSTIRAGIGSAVWCFSSQSNCHHDYFAADIFAPTGTPVVAPRDGVITTSRDSAQYPASYGSRVSLRGSDGITYYLAHMGRNTIQVEVGQRVSAGQLIGRVGTSADAQGTPQHVHIDGLPAARYNSRPPCGISISCDSYPFINLQPILVRAYNQLPD